MKCDSQETISTLRYASRAKRVRMNPVVQMVCIFALQNFFPY